MSVFKVLHYPHVLLRKRSTPVTNWSADLHEFIEGMIATMYSHQGIGLAAIQVGIPKRVMVVDISPYLANPDVKDWHGQVEYLENGQERDIQWPLKLVNPEIVEQEGEIHFPFDGCLSLPGVSASDTKRFRKIVLRARTAQNTEIEIRCDGILSICLQHELDHLEGILFIDRLMSAVEDRGIREEITAYENDRETRKQEKKLKAIDARKTKYSFV